MTQNEEDVLEGIHPMLDYQLDEPGMVAFRNADEDDIERNVARAMIFECLGPTLIKVDGVLRDTMSAASTVRMIPLELELARRLERLRSSRVTLSV